MRCFQETYEQFEARMKRQGWKRKRFRIHDVSNGKSFARALHNWYNPAIHQLNPESHPEHREEIWYKEKTI